MKTILVTPRGYARYGGEARKRLEALGYTMDINDTGKPVPREVFVEKAKEATGIIVGVDELDADLLKECKNLKAVVKFGVGVDNIDLPTCDAMGIKVGRCVGSNSNAVAELTMGMMFAAARDLVSNAMEVKNGGWSKPTGFELYQKKLGIFGFGNIGKHVARMAHGIGMEVMVYDVFDIPKADLQPYGAVQTDKETILKECDFVTLHIPLLDSTRDFISTEEFKMMKPTAVIINAARGGIINERAMYEALKNKEIKACASDVWTSEPPLASGEEWVAELLKMDNFILTAHIASRSQEAEINTVNISTDQMIKLLTE